MHRWANCPGSVRLCADMPPVTSKYAEEGTMAHELAALMLTDKAANFPSEEMRANVLIYVAYVLEEKTRATKVWIEQKLSLEKIHPNAFGTADAILYYEEQRLLKVVDFKYGAGVPVDVDDNEQLKYYALGAMLTVNQGHKVETIELVIVQPRCYHESGAIRSYAFKSFELLDFIADLKEAIARTEEPNAPLVTGDHCRFCPAQGVCPQMSKKAFDLAKLEFSQALPYDPASLAKALRAIPEIKAWCEAVNEFAYNEAMAGRVPEGFKLVEKRATRKWKDEQAVVKVAMDNKLGTDICYEEPKIKTVSQLEKTLGKKLFQSFFASNVTQESSGLTLAPVEDKRDAVASGAKKDFTAITDVDLIT